MRCDTMCCDAMQGVVSDLLRMHVETRMFWVTAMLRMVIIIMYSFLQVYRFANIVVGHSVFSFPAINYFLYLYGAL